MRANLVTALGEESDAQFSHRLRSSGRIDIREGVDDHGDVAIDLRERRCDAEHAHNRSDCRPHAAVPSRATVRAPKTRGNSVMTAGTTSTSARNATTIVSASRPPNHAVGLYADTTMIP